MCAGIVALPHFPAPASHPQSLRQQVCILLRACIESFPEDGSSVHFSRIDNFKKKFRLQYFFRQELWLECLSILNVIPLIYFSIFFCFCFGLILWFKYLPFILCIFFSCDSARKFYVITKHLAEGVKRP